MTINDIWTKECTDEKMRKHLLKISNKQVSGFEKFKSWAIIQHYQSHIQKNIDCKFSKDMKNIIDIIKSGKIKANEIEKFLASSLFHQITNLFNEGKVFDISKDVLNLLDKTNSNLSYNKLMPYSQIFIDLNELDLGGGISLYGALLIKTSVMEFVTKKGDKQRKDCLRIFAVGRDNNDNEPIWIEDFISDEGISLGYKKNKFSFMKEEHSKKVTERIANISINLLSLINHPEVEVITKSMKILRDSRIKNKKLGMPDKININLTGKLKRYVYETTQRNEKAWELGYRFWVRGHIRELKSERYINKRGETIWIMPHIKGRGELVNKNYYIGEKEQCWAHEAEMIKIIREIYPEYEIKTHNRTTLDGLEIDCYIPELKIGFEYNGKQHYEHVKIFHKTLEDFEKQKERDIEKRKRAAVKGIKIITIKYDEEVTEEVINLKLKEVKNDTNK